MNLKQLSALIISVVVVALLSGCTALKLAANNTFSDPKFTFVDHKVGTPKKRELPITLNFNAYNPNKVGLKNVYLGYELFVEGKRFLKGNNIELTLAPENDTIIAVPADIVYKDLFRALGPVAKKVVLRAKTVSVLVKVTIFGKPTLYDGAEEGGLFSFSVTTSKSIDVDIPHDKIDSAAKKAVKKAKKKLKDLKKFF